MLCVPWPLTRPACLQLREFTFGDTPDTPSRREDLNLAKEQVGVFKLKNGDTKWKSQVQLVDRVVKLENVIKRPICRAYFKLVEIVRTASVTAPSSSLHLCDAPGGFVQAVLSEFPSVKTVRYMSLLAENAPYFSQELRHLRAERIELDHDSNLLDSRVRTQIAQQSQLYDLITADGAIDNDSCPELSETASALLVACEIETALANQEEGGCFVLKVFGLSLPVTKQLISVLARSYRMISVLKPFTSRSVNDEIYVVSQGFERAKAPRFSVPPGCANRGYLKHVAVVDDAWLSDVELVSEYMAANQKNAIKAALNCTLEDETRSAHGCCPGDRAQQKRNADLSRPCRVKAPKLSTSRTF